MRTVFLYFTFFFILGNHATASDNFLCRAFYEGTCINCITSLIPGIKTLLHGIPLGAKTVSNPISRRDRALWGHAFANQSETGYWQILKVDGTLLAHSDLIIGGTNYLPFDNIFSALRKMLDKVDKEQIAAIQFTHTHPPFSRDPYSVPRYSEFSPPDIAFSKSMRNYFNSIKL